MLKRFCQTTSVTATMKNEIAGAYLNLLIGKDLDIHGAGNQSGNITVHARGWHSPSWIFNKGVRQPQNCERREEPPDRYCCGQAGCCLALGTGWRLGHLEPAPTARSPRLSRHSRVMNGRARSWQWHHHKDWHKLKLFFFPKPFISRQCSGANWTWLCAKSELRLNQFRQH